MHTPANPVSRRPQPRTQPVAVGPVATAAAALVAAAVVVLALLAPAAARAALPSPVATADYGLREVGRGQLRWLGFGIYEASLWTPDGRFDGFEAAEPMALSLWYQRKFSVDELLKITTGEWDRLGLGTPAARARWTAEQRRICRDVDRGHNMTAVVLPSGETRFYDADRLLGRVADPTFGPAFLSIWLDSRSAVRDLRVQLLGRAR
jgi:hypothetical protein